MSKQEAETKRLQTGGASGDRANLARQYGNIGISAVAAAVRYAGDAKNSAPASAREEDDQRRARSVLAV
jgi:hypothetical protein